MVLAISMLASLVVCLAVFFLMTRVRTPHYRPSRSQARQLLRDMILEQACENEWRLFCDIPIRHDDDLETIRLQCAAIDEAHFNGSRILLSREGLDKVKDVLEALESFDLASQRSLDEHGGKSNDTQ